MSLSKLAVIAPVLGAALLAATLPAGTDLQIRLKTRVASNASKAQDPVEAVLVSPVVDSGGVIVIPAGAVAKGVVKQAVPIKTPEDRALIEIEFSSLTPPGGAALKLECKLTGVDNARETVADGKIDGILASETLASRIGSGVGKVADKSSLLGGVLGAVQGAVLKEPQPEIVYEPGVEMTLELTNPLDTGHGSTVPAIPGIPSEDALYGTVNNQPFQTTTVEGGVPSDLTNLMFLGSQKALEAAFAAAGWSSAAALSRSTGLEVFRAVAEDRGYNEAPMSVLMLAGEKPDLDFEKPNNTFAMRHHLRVWRRPGDFQGHPVWVCAATHDIGISFSAAKRTFIHKIDSQVDRERAKVVADLVFTGNVKALSLVERPAAPEHSQNATGDKIETDARMAVLLLE
jgi:LssY C-terminus